MDGECKWSGSVHDAKLFSNSYLCQSLKNGNLTHTLVEAINDLIRDPDYPPTPFCMKEFQICAENKHVMFNILCWEMLGITLKVLLVD